MTYKTTDIVLASCLKLNGYKLETIEVDVSGKGTFVFADVPDPFITDFDLGNILVEPVLFNNTLKQLTTSVRRMK